MKYLSRVGWWLFLVCMPLLLYGFGLALGRSLTELRGSETHIIAFASGAVLFVVIYRLTRRFFSRPWNYLATLEHELTHALIGLVFLKVPVSLRVTAYEGGEVVLRHGANVWIRLAPYYFPTLSLALLLLNYLFWGSTAVHFYVVLGVTVAFHLVTTWQEVSFRQTDLRDSGIIASALLLPVLNLIFYGAILSFVVGGSKGLEGFFGTAWRATHAAGLNLVTRLLSFFPQ